MSCIFFVSGVVEEFNYPIDCFRFHVIETDILAMSLENWWGLIDFCVVLGFCVFAEKIESFGLLDWGCYTG
jgi:hypothetical protein